MSYFVVVPGALVPASIAPQLLARAKLPQLARLVRHARAQPPERLAGQGAAHLDWLWMQFGGADGPVTAPYAWQALTGARPADAPLWQADPVHFAFARDHMLVAALDAAASVSVVESRALSAAAAEIAHEFGATLTAVDAQHWFIVFDPPWRLRTTALDAALGQSAQFVLPEGDAAPRWRKVLTEIQIRWHQHPINEQRDGAGVRTINGVWLHGGGTWQVLPRRPFEVVAADDAAIRGWALASGLAPTSVFDGETRPGGVASALVYWPGLLQSRAHADWDAWLDRLAAFESELEAHVTNALSEGVAEVVLILAGRAAIRRVSIRSSDRFRPWRKQSIAELFAEQDPA